MRAALLTALLALACGNAAAQIAAPDAWRKESFTFPLPFAPSIPYEGTEHVRFSPEWTKFDSGRGFTYVVLWDIARRALEPAEIQRALHVYFDGLMESVTKAREIADPGTVSTVSLHPLTTPARWDGALGGRVWTWNGFGKAEALALHTEITHRACGERTQVLYLYSMAPRTDAVWQELRAIRDATACPSAPARTTPP